MLNILLMYQEILATIQLPWDGNMFSELLQLVTKLFRRKNTSVFMELPQQYQIEYLQYNMSLHNVKPHVALLHAKTMMNTSEDIGC